MSRRLRECHGAVVKTVVKSAALRDPLGRASSGAKTSQEFTSRLTECQEVSWRVSASQRVSSDPSRPRFDGLPASRTRDTVRRMVQVLRDVQEVATDAGQRLVSARLATAWHGTRNTVPSRAFAAGSVVTRYGTASNDEGRR